MDNITGGTVTDVGEFGLIDRIRSRLAAAQSDVLLGAGDDAALIATGSLTLACADILIEGIHFDLSLSSPADAGYKALAVNVSDIAAMGGLARFALVSLAVPPGTPLRIADGLYDGLLDAAREMGVAIIGGDCSTASQIVLSVAMLGAPPAGGPVTRSGAQPGDVVCVTGTVGAAAAGLSLARIAPDRSEAAALLERFPSLLAAHRRPSPRTAAGPAAGDAGATAMIDVSDGLARDAGHIAEESDCGMRLDAAAIPVGPGVREAAELLGIDAHRFAAGGGDDYELVITVPEKLFDALAAAVAPLALTRIGEVLPKGAPRTLTMIDGGDVPLAGAGWEHFS